MSSSRPGSRASESESFYDQDLDCSRTRSALGRQTRPTSAWERVEEKTFTIQEAPQQNGTCNGVAKGHEYMPSKSKSRDDEEEEENLDELLEGMEEDEKPKEGSTANLNDETKGLSSPQPNGSINPVSGFTESQVFLGSKEESDDDDEDKIVFKPFTKETLRRLEEREAEEKKLAEEKAGKQQEAILVDGELKFNDDEDGEVIEKDPSLVEGNPLPVDLALEFPKSLHGKPIEEIDQYIKEKIDYGWVSNKTFVVIAPKFRNSKYIFRFSATRAFFCLAPWNPVRRAALYVVSNQFFDYIIILTILINCIMMAILDAPEEPEFVFLGIYTIEMIAKLLARGFILNKFTYLRDPWNWLDFIVVILAYITVLLEKWILKDQNSEIGGIAALRTFRVLRAFKTFAILPGLKTIISAVFKSMKMLAEVMVLIVFCMTVLSLFAIQLYMGLLLNKCIEIPPATLPNGTNFTTYHEYYADWIAQSAHWYDDGDGGYQLCGNVSGTQGCPNGYLCLPDQGLNPNNDYTHFDDFIWAMLNIFQLVTLDFWEDTYNKVVKVAGGWNILFFMAIVFFGSFYLINLLLAVVAMSYEEEAKAQEAERERKEKEQKRKEKKAILKAKQKKKKQGSKAVLDVTKLSGHILSSHTDLRGDEPDKNHLKVDTVHQNGSAHSLHSSENGHAGKSHTDLKKGNVGSKVSLRSVSKDTEKVIGNNYTAVENAEDKRKKFAEQGKDNATFTMESETDTMGTQDTLVETIASSEFHNKMSEDEAHQKETVDGSKVSTSGVKIVETKVENKDKEADQLGSVVDNKETMSLRSDELPKESDPADEESEDEYADRNCKCCLKCCCHYPSWRTCQIICHKITSEPLFEWFITACIMLNTLFMAIEHVNMPNDLKNTMDYFNYLFTTIFTLEAVLKLMALAKDYFKSGWNVFDFVIVVFSLLELVLLWANLASLPGVSSVRTLRLFRVFKLAQSWTTMRVLLTIILKTMGSLTNVTIVLAIVMYIFAVIGMQLFRNAYLKAFADDIGLNDRWHFNDLGHALMMVFRILCGEWIEPLWDCMQADANAVSQTGACIPVFLITLMLGNFLVLNLFLALLLNSFGSDSLSEGENTKKKKKKESRLLKKLRAALKIGVFRKKSTTVSPSREGSMAKVEPNKNEEVNPDKEKTIPEVTFKIEDEGLYDEKHKVGQNGEHLSTNGDLELQTLHSNGDLKSLSSSGMLTPQSNGVIRNKNIKNIDEAFHTQRGQFTEFPTTRSGPKGSTLSVRTMTSETKEQIENEKNKQKLEEDKRDTEKEEKVKGEDALKADEEDEEDKKSLTEKEKEDKMRLKDEDAEDEKLADIEAHTIVDCCPAPCYKMSKCCASWDDTKVGKNFRKTRVFFNNLVTHKVFEGFIIFLILASSTTLVFEDTNLPMNPQLGEALRILNTIFTVLFTIEMLLKWIAFGFKKYFTDFWTILDFVIVCISVFGIISDGIESVGNISAFRALRTLRALRPLRAVSRLQGMKIVVNALAHAIPSFINVLMVGMIFWLIFAIMGVQLLGGKFYNCYDGDGNKLQYNASYLTNKTECLALGYDWSNDKIHFNNVFAAVLAIFQVCTFEGWMEVMEAASDMTDIDLVPRFEYSYAIMFYFVAVIIVGAFFTLNLFIGVIIDNFNMLKKKYEGTYLDMFLTAHQKNYYHTLRKLGNKKPQKTIRRPKNKVQGFFFDVAMSNKFEMSIVVLIFVNMLLMTLEHYRQSALMTQVLEYFNIVFTTIFSLEALVKIIGMRWHYFRRVWNVFDFIIVVLSIVGIAFNDFLKTYFVTPSLLRVVRVFRIGRVLRLVKAAKGIRKLLFALMISLPALINIGALLLMLMFIFAIIMMISFGFVKKNGAIDDTTNFENFGNSLMLMFRLSTSAGWNDILDGLMIHPPDCNNTHVLLSNGSTFARSGGDCGDDFLAILFMIIYLILTFLIVINMYIAVILENFNQAHEQEEIGITEDDFEMFYVVWERYDPHATQYIKYEQLSDFVGELEEPLGMPKPNGMALVAFNLPIVEGDMMHCLDILMALVKHVLGDVEETEEFKQLRQQMQDKFNESFPTRVNTNVIATTMQRKKEDVAARTLQRCWKKHKMDKAFAEFQQAALAQLALERSQNQETLSPKMQEALTKSRPASAVSRLSSRTSINVEKSPTPSRKMSTTGNTLQVPGGPSTT
ncbi:sodium channel protein 1 brain [Lingula anatina]|uniref:Sodium channel protein n=1 Tax=Lingula anatina TaxID=7574 RepID=A0A1S3JTX6_LINAN|nr:sodium channel protein 1 brain [Lingula anatina]|eukprot:XP_013413556.1 sodium channel protein 1 brain [Lingula anatina]